jgi:molybdopterin/thiamine biosynthesis adenylyltransferase
MTERHARNIGLIGAEGQHRIEETSVAIVGYGGLGSHIGQQLAYLGTREFAIVDGDIVTETSLNRLVGAVPDDAAAGVRKVDVALRVIQAINPAATVQPICGLITDAESLAAVTGADLVIGAVDNDTARLKLIELFSPRHIPYIDVATDAGEFDTGSVWYGGRVYVTRNGHGCLACADLLDQRELSRAAMTPEQQAADDRIYGVDRRLLGATGPMVVSINGVVASIAVTEFVALVTGLRAPKRHLVYRGELGVVLQNTDPPRNNCYYCSQWSGDGDTPDSGLT